MENKGIQHSNTAAKAVQAQKLASTPVAPEKKAHGRAELAETINKLGDEQALGLSEFPTSAKAEAKVARPPTPQPSPSPTSDPKADGADGDLAQNERQATLQELSPDQLTSDESHANNRAAVEKAARRGDERALNILGQTLGSDDYARASWAAESLQEAQKAAREAGRDDPVTGEHLKLLLQSNNYHSRKILEDAVGSNRPEALTAVRVHLQNPDQDSYTKSRAAEILAAKKGPVEATDYSLLLSSKEKPKDSLACRRLVEDARNGNEAARDALRKGLSDPDPEKRKRAADLLGRVPGLIGPEEAESLTRMAREEQSAEAARALGRAAGRGEAAAQSGAEELGSTLSREVAQGSTLAHAEARIEKAKNGDLEAQQWFKEQKGIDRHLIGDLLEEEVQFGNYAALDALKFAPRMMSSALRDKRVREVEQRFAESNHPAEKARMAAYVLESTSDREIAAEALEMVQQQAAAGDSRALSSLARLVSDYGARPQVLKEQVKQATETLTQMAESGQAERIAETVLTETRQRAERGYNTGSAALELLARTSAQLNAEHPLAQAVRGEFRRNLSEERTLLKPEIFNSMRHIKHQLGEEDLRAVADVVKNNPYDAGGEAAGFLAETLPQLPKEKADSLAEETLSVIRSQLGGKHNYDALQKMSRLGAYLSPDDIKALGPELSSQTHSRNGVSATLASVLASETADDGDKAAAMKALMETAPSNLSPETRKLMVDFALETNNPALKEKLLQDILPKRPDHTRAMEDMGRQVEADIENQALKAYEERRTSDPLYRLGQLYHVRKLGMEGGEFQGQIDQQEIAQRIAAMTDPNGSNPNTARAVQKIASDTTTKWREGRGRYTVDSQREWMESEDFQQRLRLMSPEERDKAIKQSVHVLCFMDPTGAEEAGKALVEKTLQSSLDRPLENLASMEPKQRSRVLERMLEEQLPVGAFGTKTARDLAAELQKLNPTTSRSEVERRIKEHLRQAGVDIGTERLTGALTALGVAGFGFSLGRQDWSETSVTDVVNLAGQAANTGAGILSTGRTLASKVIEKLPEGSLLRRASQSGTMLKVAGRLSKGLPLAGDLASFFLDTHAAAEAFQKEDSAKAWTYSAAAGLGAIAFGCATFGALNAWNPAGWAALGFGAAAGTVSFVAAQMDGKNEKLVKELGLFDPAAAVYYATHGATTDDVDLRTVLAGLSPDERKVLRGTYQHRYKESVEEAIRSDTSGDYEDALVGLTRDIPGRHDPAADARALDLAMNRRGTDEDVVTDIVTGRSPDQLKAIDQALRVRTGKSLRNWIVNDTDGEYRKALLATLTNAGL